MANIFIEFSLGVLVILVIYFTILIPLYPRVQQLSDNSLASPSKNVVDLVTGSIPLNSYNITINTKNPSRPSYTNLPKSTYYPQGGFAYSFWLNTKTTSNNDLKNHILLLRGVNKVAQVSSFNRGGSDIYDSRTIENNKILVKMPMIRFAGDNDFAEDEVDQVFKTKVPLVVEYNTTQTPLEKWIINNDVLTITRGDKWYMITVVFEDLRNEYGNKTGYRIDFYIDDRLVDSRAVEDVGLITNEGPIYILPHPDGWPVLSTTMTGFMSDIRYLDFAPNAVEVSNIYDKSYSEGNYVTPKTQAIKNVYDDYRLMSLYNEVRANSVPSSQ